MHTNTCCTTTLLTHWQLHWCNLPEAHRTHTNAVGKERLVICTRRIFSPAFAFHHKTGILGLLVLYIHYCRDSREVPAIVESTKPSPIPNDEEATDRSFEHLFPSIRSAYDVSNGCPINRTHWTNWILHQWTCSFLLLLVAVVGGLPFRIDCKKRFVTNDDHLKWIDDVLPLRFFITCRHLLPFWLIWASKDMSCVAPLI